ncbi:hypothetical protein ACHQM5_005035 [Ranunculus cassubicifolius]
MTDLKYPLKSNTMYAVLLPIVIFVFVYYRRRDVYDLHHSILGEYYFAKYYCAFMLHLWI